MKLQDQVALVTGSAVGIGRATALALAGAGASVVVNYTRSEAEARETAAAIEALGRRTLLVRADVADDAQVRGMMEQVEAAFSRLDILVNNAGISTNIDFSDLEGLTEEKWDRVFGVNLKGAFFCSKAAAKLMLRQGKGCIVNVASAGGIRPLGNCHAYCASKAGMISLTTTLAIGLAPHVRVNAVAPSFTDTRWHTGLPGYEAKKERAGSRSLLGRPGKPEDVADLILSLVADLNYVNGQVIQIHGGLK